MSYILQIWGGGALGGLLGAIMPAILIIAYSTLRGGEDARYGGIVAIAVLLRFGWIGFIFGALIGGGLAAYLGR